MIAHLARVQAQPILPLFVGPRVRRGQVRVDRHFGVDRRCGRRRAAARPGPASDASRPRRSPIPFREVALLEHAGQLDDAPELDFAPSAAHVRRLQRARQPFGGRRAAALVRTGARAVATRPPGRSLRALCRPSLSWVCTRASASRTGCRSASAFCDEVGAVFLERVARQGRKRVAQLRLRVGQQRLLFVGQPPRRLELGRSAEPPRPPARPRVRRRRGGSPRARPDKRDWRADA